MAKVSAVSTTIRPPVVQQPIVREPSLDDQLQVALEHARRVTKLYGAQHVDVALAWETVEELRTAQLQREAAQKNTFEQYCEDYPEALESRVYEC
ncbi:MAG: CP12 domain-containing protein [Cyanobacteria bacterium P01_H01_bin.15]